MCCNSLVLGDVHGNELCQTYFITGAPDDINLLNLFGICLYIERFDVLFVNNSYIGFYSL